MIFVGTDIIEVSRLREVMERNGSSFLKKVFTPDEISYCSERAEPAIHYAGRFAAKEAVKKAVLSHDSTRILPLNFISIKNREDGAPYVEIQNDASNIQISLSHTHLYATAVAVLEVK